MILKYNDTTEIEMRVYYYYYYCAGQREEYNVHYSVFNYLGNTEFLGRIILE